MLTTGSLVLSGQILLAYLLGAFPSSVVVGRVAKGIDLRHHGSGNAGASNAFRVLGRGLGAAVLIMDVAKGAAAVTLIPLIAPNELIGLFLGAAAILGHVYSPFLRFRGGKGVGTAAGVLLVLYPFPLAIAVSVFVLILLVFGITSLASLIAALSFPAATALLGASGVIETSPSIFVFSVVAVLFLLFTHRENVRRLVRGEENRFEGIRVLGRLFTRLFARDRRDGPGKTG